MKDPIISIRIPERKIAIFDGETKFRDWEPYVDELQATESATIEIQNDNGGFYQRIKLRHVSKILITLLLSFIMTAQGGVVVRYNPQSFPITNEVTGILASANTLDWIGQSNVLINPAIPASAEQRWKVTNGLVVAFVAADFARIAATNAILATNAINRLNEFTRTNAAAQLDATGGSGEMRILRSMLGLVMNELNILRTNPAIGMSARTTNQLNNALRNAITNANN